MARYIDADAAVEEARLAYCKDCNSYNGVICRSCGFDDAMSYIDGYPEADVVPKSEVDQLKKALAAKDAEYDQALQDKARECNMVIDMIRLEHRAKLALLHSSHEQELAKAKRDIARKVIAEVDLLISKYHLEPYYSVNDMEIDIAELSKKYTKGATDGKAY